MGDVPGHGPLAEVQQEQVLPALLQQQHLRMRGHTQTPLEVRRGGGATWSPEVRVWKGARHLAHLTAMKSSRAAVSCSVSQLVGSEGSAEGSSGGLSSCAGVGAGGGGKRFRFRSTPERKECGPNSEAAAGGASEERGDTGPGPGNTLFGNMEPEPNSEWPPGKRSGEGLECGNPKLVGVRKPSLDTLGFLGPRSCCTASLFMELSKHFLSLQALHWLR